eukprot:766513-Hanusia_phi.AAC.3
MTRRLVARVHPGQARAFKLRSTGGTLEGLAKLTYLPGGSGMFGYSYGYLRILDAKRQDCSYRHAAEELQCVVLVYVK